jgi:DNA-binding transcriptional regulator of glucitol operon
MRLVTKLVLVLVIVVALYSAFVFWQMRDFIREDQNRP